MIRGSVSDGKPRYQQPRYGQPRDGRPRDGRRCRGRLSARASMASGRQPRATRSLMIEPPPWGYPPAAQRRSRERKSANVLWGGAMPTFHESEVCDGMPQSSPNVDGVIVKPQALEVHLVLASEASARTADPSVDDPEPRQIPTTRSRSENGEQRLALEIHRSRAENPEIAEQRLGRASITHGNVGGSYTPGKRTAETELAGWGGIRTAACASRAASAQAQSGALRVRLWARANGWRAIRFPELSIRSSADRYVWQHQLSRPRPNGQHPESSHLVRDLGGRA
jgi:hypothetical protein